ncbi:hypothetical protein [Dactylosporangium sp. NPDC005555]|uniref:hypothetical protein n=1 Tax=Dactylosporangium sp. NPDC005555 TaxID=3154889 RepID=UPI0033BD5CA3
MPQLVRGDRSLAVTIGDRPGSAGGFLNWPMSAHLIAVEPFIRSELGRFSSGTPSTGRWQQSALGSAAMHAR